jgi:hypothetical protein
MLGPIEFKSRHDDDKLLRETHATREPLLEARAVHLRRLVLNVSREAMVVA